MKVVIAPQAFKGTLKAREAAQAIHEGLRRVLPQVQGGLIPIADGGDGTLEVLVEASRGQYRSTWVTGPLGEGVEARWGVLGNGVTAVLEMAQVCGLVLIPPEHRNPLVTTTYGLGELIRHCLDQGFRQFLLGIGGSGTNDGGAGMAQALGVRMLDQEGHDLPPGGGVLTHLGRIDLTHRDTRLEECAFQVATDVTNPLCGPQGASMVYGPQKGASPDEVCLLDTALRHYAEVLQRDVGVEVLDLLGAGAAGGLGAGLVAFLGAELLPGGDLVCQVVGLEDHLKGADLVVTGEGRLDGQTLYNKAPRVVVRQAAARGIPVLMVVGSLGEGWEEALAKGVSLVEAASSSSREVPSTRESAFTALADAGERVVRRFLKG